jgi:hypothetical protein
VLQTLGYKAGKDTVKDQCPDLALRVITPLLKIIKAEHRSELDWLRRKNRVHVEVLAKGALMSQDSTHTGTAEGRKAWAEGTKDAATCISRAFGDGKPITVKKDLEHLESLKKSGDLPLVLARDNYPVYKDAKEAQWAHTEQLVLLYSEPHTPQHNGRMERSFGEGKPLAGLGKGVELKKASDGVLGLDKAFQTLNQLWPRRSKGGFTACELEKLTPHWNTKTTRAEFYEATQLAIEEASVGLKGRALRKATREAIFRTLERFGLILRTRGELKPSKELQDRIS